MHIHTHLLNQFRGLMLGHPMKNPKSPHFAAVAGNTDNCLCGGGRCAAHSAPQAIHVERGQTHHRKCATNESSTCTEPSRRQNEVMLLWVSLRPTYKQPCP